MDLERMVDCLRIDLLGDELKLRLFRFLLEISTGTGLIITFAFDLPFVGLSPPVFSNLVLFTISIAYFPLALTLFLID